MKTARRKKITNAGPEADRTPCDVCGRKCGTLNVRGNHTPRNPLYETPLGKIERCDLCGKAACPDCLHEADCCFADTEDRAGDWAPNGWRLVENDGTKKTFERIGT